MKRSYPLTKRQRAVLEALAVHTATQGAPPTLRELARTLGIASTNGINDHLVALERRGLVVRDARRARGLRLTPRGTKVSVPACLACGGRATTDRHFCAACVSLVPTSLLERARAEGRLLELARHLEALRADVAKSLTARFEVTA